MPDLDPRTPVLVGVAQASWPDGDAPDPIAMMAQVVTAAAQDARAGEPLLRRAGILAAVGTATRAWADPAALVAGRLGLAPALTVRTTNGGDSPHALVGELGRRIAAGQLDAGVIVSAEALATLARAMKAQTEPAGWPEPEAGPPAPGLVYGSDRPDGTAAEQAIGLIAPMMMYPLLEHGLWARSGLGLADYRLRLGTLAERFNRVARANPYAWSPAPRTAQEIATPTPDNRQVTLPYTKLLNANIQTDQSAALILASVDTARALGVPADRWIFVHGHASAHDEWFVSERAQLDRSPAIRLAGAAALAAAGAGADDVAHLDLYSCFPSAVQIAGAELGIDPFTDPRPPTVTGGLTFAGGPGNNYVTHALAAMAGRLREHPDDLGLVTAVGWYLTKHGVGVYGARPPRGPFAPVSVQEQVDALPGRTVAEGHTGDATGEAACVIYERDGSPSLGMVTALLDDGRRVLAGTDAAHLLAELVAGPITGRAARVDGRALLSLG